MRDEIALLQFWAFPADLDAVGQPVVPRPLLLRISSMGREHLLEEGGGSIRLLCLNQNAHPIGPPQ